MTEKEVPAADDEPDHRPWSKWPQPHDPQRIPRYDAQAADAWCARMCAAAGQVAAAIAVWLDLVAAFDESGAWSGVGIRNCAHWLSWACSVSPGTAREHVRVAHALQQLPLIKAAFAAGELSYSKVREATRVGHRITETTLLELARNCTASQFERSIRGFRRHDTDRLEQELRRRARWHTDTDGSVILHARLPAEEGALIVAALEKSADQLRRKESEAISNADALLHIIRSFTQQDRPVDVTADRGLVVVRVDTESLSATHPPAAEATPADGAAPIHRAECEIPGIGGLTAGTAARMACDGHLLAMVEQRGRPLAHGRRRRLVSPVQRRALEIRDKHCQHPGCQRTTMLEAHHVVPWSAGGATDLDNLILLCRSHHMLFHEGRFSLTRRDDGWAFFQPNGLEIMPNRWNARCPEEADQAEVEAALELLAVDRGELEEVRRWTDPRAERIRPGWRGERFSLADTVSVLFGAKRLRPTARAAA